MTSREELKALRNKAVGVVGDHMNKTAAMYTEIIEYGAKIDVAREAARNANLNALDEQIADLKEDYEDLKEFANAPLAGSKTGQKPSTVAAVPNAATAKPEGNSEALAALNKATPNPADWGDGNAYHGAHPPEDPPPIKASS